MSKQLSHRAYEVIVPVITLLCGALGGAIYGYALCNHTWNEYLNDQMTSNTLGDFDEWR